MRKESPRPFARIAPVPAAGCYMAAAARAGRGGVTHSATPQLDFAGGKEGLRVGSGLDRRDHPDSCAAPPWLCKER